MDRATETEILDTAFEPCGDGFLYFDNRYSRGRAVTAEERETYLSMRGIFQRRRWAKEIKLRQPVAARRAGDQARVASSRLRAAIPWKQNIYALVMGSFFLAVALNQNASPLWRALAALASLLVLGSCLANLVARWRRRPRT